MPWGSCPFNEVMNATEPECKSPTQYFWYRTTLDASPSMDDSGGLKWWIVLCLFLAWTIVFLIVMKGIQSSGKVKFMSRWSGMIRKNIQRRFVCFLLGLLGCIFHVDVPVHCADNILHTGDNAGRCRCRSSPHVYTRNVQAIAADSVAGRCYSSILFIWVGLRFTDRIR